MSAGLAHLCKVSITHPVRLGEIDHRISDVSLSRNGLRGSEWNEVPG